MVYPFGDTPFLMLQAGLERAAAAQLSSYPAGWELKQQIKWEIMENTGIRPLAVLRFFAAVKCK